MTKVMEKMQTLLDHERELLLRQDLESLSSLAQQKQALLPHLGTLTHAERAKLKAHSKENEARLGATLRGLKSTIRRLRALASLGAPMETYGRDGQRSALGGKAPGKVEHRA